MTTNRHMQSAEELGLARDERLLHTDRPGHVGNLTRDWLRYHARQQFVGDRYAYLHLWLTKSRVS
jgi:hypothetical protein